MLCVENDVRLADKANILKAKAEKSEACHQARRNGLGVEDKRVHCTKAARNGRAPKRDVPLLGKKKSFYIQHVNLQAL